MIPDEKDPAPERQAPVGRSIRLLLILEEVARLGTPATPAEINRGIGLPKQTLHRLLTMLESEGFLQREIDGRTYAPGTRLRGMATDVMSSTRIRTARVAVMRALAREVGETCNLVIPDREAMIYLDRVETDWPLRIQLQIGTRVPFHCTASGKLYLSTLRPAQLHHLLNAAPLERKTGNTITDPDTLIAEIERIQAEGFATDNEEFIDGMVAVAVPVHDLGGRMVASLAFHAPTLRMSMTTAITHLPRLRTAAAGLSRILIGGLYD